MANPAALLYDLLESWEVPTGETVESVRGLTLEPESLPAWRAQALAVGYLEDIYRELDGLRIDNYDVDDYIEYLPNLHAAVFNIIVPAGTATSAGTRQVADREMKSTLRHLRLQLDTSARHADLSEEGVAALLTAVSEAITIVMDDRSLPAEERRYVLSLLQEARNAIENNGSTGILRIRSSTQEAAGAILGAAGHLRAAQPERAGRLASLGLAIATAISTTLSTEGTQWVLSILTGDALPPGK